MLPTLRFIDLPLCRAQRKHDFRMCIQPKKHCLEKTRTRKKTHTQNMKKERHFELINILRNKQTNMIIIFNNHNHHNRNMPTELLSINKYSLSGRTNERKGSKVRINKTNIQECLSGRER